MAGSTDREVEAKFLVRDLTALAERLRGLGAVQTGERVFEANLRFDTPARELSAAGRVLRLRQDREARLTYKGPSQTGAEVTDRQEIEFGVSDFSAARRLLKALGYEVSAMYEKYRTTYQLRDLEVVLDELPYGNFIEIEGPGARAIHHAAIELGLRWAARSAESYLALFERLRAGGLKAVSLSFEALAGVEVKPAALGLEYADL
jgi:adenylate cyclase class 2